MTVIACRPMRNLLKIVGDISGSYRRSYRFTANNIVSYFPPKICSVMEIIVSYNPVITICSCRLRYSGLDSRPKPAKPRIAKDLISNARASDYTVMAKGDSLTRQRNILPVAFSRTGPLNFESGRHIISDTKSPAKLSVDFNVVATGFSKCSRTAKPTLRFPSVDKGALLISLCSEVKESLLIQ